MGLFMTVICLAFRDLGRLLRSCGRDKAKFAMAWALGVALFIHIMSFVSIAYTGQVIVVWYMLIAGISSLCCAQSEELRLRQVALQRSLGARQQVPAHQVMRRENAGWNVDLESKSRNREMDLGDQQAIRREARI